MIGHDDVWDIKEDRLDDFNSADYKVNIDLKEDSIKFALFLILFSIVMALIVCGVLLYG